MAECGGNPHYLQFEFGVTETGTIVNEMQRLPVAIAFSGSPDDGTKIGWQLARLDFFALLAPVFQEVRGC